MHKLLVLYNEPKDPAHFRKYYVETHVPLASKLPGLKASRYAFDAKPLGPGKAHFCVFEAEFESEAEWKRQTHRLGARLHPLTIEQNALTSFKSRTTLVPAFANTIGPALFLGADRIIGGCDRTFGRGMMWQGLSVWMTLRHEPTPWIPSTYMPTQPGRMFILQELAGPLVAECN